MGKTHEQAVEDFRAYLGEGIHTAFRKAGQTRASSQVWNLIREMPPEEWSGIVRFVAVPMFEYAEELIKEMNQETVT